MTWHLELWFRWGHNRGKLRFIFAIAMLEANLDNIVWIICSKDPTNTLILIECTSFRKLWMFQTISWDRLIQTKFKNFICAEIAYLQHLMLGFLRSREDMDIWYEILVFSQIDSAILH